MNSSTSAFLLGLPIKYNSSIPIVAVGLGVLVYDLGITHTLSSPTMMTYSMANSKHKHGECMGREQSRIGIIIWLFKNGRILFPIVSPTELGQSEEPEIVGIRPEVRDKLLPILLLFW